MGGTPESPTPRFPCSCQLTLVLFVVTANEPVYTSLLDKLLVLSRFPHVSLFQDPSQDPGWHSGASSWAQLDCDGLSDSPCFDGLDSG